MGMGTGEVTETRNYKSEEIAFDPPSFELFLLTSSSSSSSSSSSFSPVRIKKKEKIYAKEISRKICETYIS